MLLRFLKDEAGQTVLESGLVIITVSVAAISALLAYKGGGDALLAQAVDFATNIL